MKKTILTYIILILFLLTGCFESSNEKKNDFKIVLTNSTLNFVIDYEKNVVSGDMVVEKKDARIRMEFSNIKADYNKISDSLNFTAEGIATTDNIGITKRALGITSNSDSSGYKLNVSITNLNNSIKRVADYTLEFTAWGKIINDSIDKIYNERPYMNTASLVPLLYSGKIELAVTANDKKEGDLTKGNIESIVINWGDNTSTTKSGINQSSIDTKFIHNYDKVGLYDITVIAKDLDGNETIQKINGYSAKIVITDLKLRKGEESGEIYEGQRLVLPTTATAIISDGTTKDVKVISWDEPKDPLKAQKTPYVYVGRVEETNKTVTYNLLVKEVALDKIEITALPNKVNYLIGETIDLNGLEVTGVYSDGTKKKELITNDKVSGFTSLTLGEKVLTVTLNGKTAIFSVSVIQESAKLVNIDVTKNPNKTIYFVGEKIDIAGLEVTGTYSDRTTKLENVENGHISGFDSSVVGDKLITVTINGKIATFIVSIKMPVLVNIVVTKNPNKRVYFVGEQFDITGLEVTGTYDDKSIKLERVVIGNISGFDSTTAGDKLLTVTINGKKTTFTVSVKKLTLVGIDVTKNPFKTSYFVGEKLDITGLEVTGSYDDKSTKLESIVLGDISGFDSSTIGDKLLTITVKGKIATFIVRVNNAALISIAINKNPNKINYFVGEKLDINGLEVLGYYDDKSTKIEAIGLGNITGFDSSTAGNKMLTVTINGKTARFGVVVNEVVLVSIAVTKTPNKKSYFVGEKFDFAGLEVTGTYNDNSTRIESVGAGNISGFDSLKAGNRVLTVTINGKTATFTVVINDVSLVSIAVTKTPNKMNYFVGERLDITGLEVTGTYNDNTTKVESVGAGNITGFDSLTSGNKVLTITVNGTITTFTISITDIVLVSIAVTKTPNKTNYFVGERLDISGLEVTGTYNDNTSKLETIGAGDISRFDSSIPGNKVLTITINGKTTTFTVVVNAVNLVNIIVTTNPTKLSYFMGETFTTDGMIVTATMSDNSTKVVKGWTITKPDMTLVERKTITVTYVEGSVTSTANFTIDVSYPAWINGMVWVPNGSAPTNTGVITVSNSFYIGKYEVTQSEFQTLMGFNPSNFQGDLNKPVENVSWYDCVEYCNKKSIAEGLTPYYTITNYVYTGRVGVSNISSATVVEATSGAGLNGYRLPTSNEWEYAARGGNTSKGFIYSGSNTITDVAWYNANAYLMGPNYPDYGTHVGGQKLPNELFIYDMSGNVAEWCNDAQGTSSRDTRGGSFYNNDSFSAMGTWYYNSASGFGFNLGLRILRLK